MQSSLQWLPNFRSRHRMWKVHHNEWRKLDLLHASDLRTGHKQSPRMVIYCPICNYWSMRYTYRTNIYCLQLGSVSFIRKQFRQYRAFSAMWTPSSILILRVIHIQGGAGSWLIQEFKKSSAVAFTYTAPSVCPISFSWTYLQHTFTKAKSSRATRVQDNSKYLNVQLIDYCARLVEDCLAVINVCTWA